MRVRPQGITILAVLAGIGCVLGAVVVLAAMGGNGTVRGGSLAYLVALLIVVLGGVTAHGLWTMRWWAWPIAILSWGSAGVQAIISLTSGTLSTDLVVAPIALVYLLQGDVRAAFGARIASPGRRLVAVTAALALVSAALPIGAAAASRWSPAVPADAGSTLLAQIEVPPPAAPEAGSEEPTHAGGDCLDRNQRPAGWLDLCWSVVRLPDGDPAGDYYRFEARGTFASDATDLGQAPGTGIRWMVLRNVLLTPVVDGVSSVQPDGVTEGCPASDAIGQASSGRPPELPCDGKTVGSADLQSHTVTWTCVGCLLAESTERAIGLSEDVKVGEGVAPAWRLHADFGG